MGQQTESHPSHDSLSTVEDYRQHCVIELIKTAASCHANHQLAVECLNHARKKAALFGSQIRLAIENIISMRGQALCFEPHPKDNESDEAWGLYHTDKMRLFFEDYTFYGKRNRRMFELCPEHLAKRTSRVWTSLGLKCIESAVIKRDRFLITEVGELDVTRIPITPSPQLVSVTPYLFGTEIKLPNLDQIK